MIVALIDNGSLEPAAHRNLRAVAAALSDRAGIPVRAVSWKHSDRIAPDLLAGTPAWTLAPFVRALVALGQREFVFVPFFISPQGAIGSALRTDLEMLQRELPSPFASPLAGADRASSAFEFSFTAALAARGVIPAIIAERIRATLTAAPHLARPPVIIVDHGGPSTASAVLRDQIVASARELLGREIGPLVAASMEGVHPPLLADTLRAPAFSGADVIVAPLFLSPGRHAGPDGDIARICRAAEGKLGSSVASASTGPSSPRTSASARTRCHVTDLVGTHPLAVDTLAAALRDTLSTLHAQPFA